MKHRQGAQYLGPDELALLQICFDTIIARQALERSSEEANAVATALMKAFARGITDKQELIRLADIVPDLRTTGYEKPAAWGPTTGL